MTRQGEELLAVNSLKTNFNTAGDVTFHIISTRAGCPAWREDLARV
ncbi:hypothetical protein DEDE109153_09710 [Deinococcus deserti]